MTAILVNAKQESPPEEGNGVRDLHPSPGALPPLIALTADAGLSQAVREVAAAGELSHVSTVEEFSERLMKSASGIALIDSAAVPTAIQPFVDGMAQQFPELVLVVAGGLAEQSQLAAQIGSGRVYRFVHKPASAQRLKLFMDAAARHHAELARQAAMPAPVVNKTRQPKAAPAAQPQADGSGTRKPPSPGILIGAGIAVLALVAVGLFYVLRGGPASQSVAPVAARPEPDARALQQAAQAKARSELEQLLASAETALTEARIDDAERLAVAAQAMLQTDLPGTENSRVRFLQTQIARERERVGDEEQRRSAIGARKERVATYVRLAGERMQKGTLIEPSRDSAVYYVETALDLSPGDSDALQARSALIKALLATADRSLGNDDIDGARRVVDVAASLGAPKVELDRLRRRADELRSGAASASAVQEPGATAPAAASGASPTPATSASAAPAAAATSPAVAPASTASAATVSANSLNRVRYVEVQYPDSARMQGVVGFVEMEFTVTADGAVKDLVVLEAEPRNTFERNTVAAVRKWRYAPVLRDGVAVEQRARLRVRFNSK